MTAGHFLRSLFNCAVDVADPMHFIGPNLPALPQGRVLVVGAGKASARMAEAVEDEWGPCEGLIITRYGCARPTRRIEIVEAAHPVPDQAGVTATLRMLSMLNGLSENDLVLVLISGGASALLCAPAGTISLDEKQAVNVALLSSGAPIGQMNILRKHLSRVKGGQLAAAAAPAQVLALMISDVPGDDPALIGSGPTVGDMTSNLDALAIADRWGVRLPDSVRTLLVKETGVISPEDIRLAHVRNYIVAAPAQSLSAAAELVHQKGYDHLILGDDLCGEARDVAGAHARLALKKQAKMKPGDRPLVIISGGELTVTRRGNGSGGPNAEYALALALSLEGAFGIYAIACDTDGVDGAAEVAGAVIDPTTLTRACAAGVDPHQALAGNDSHSFFEGIGDQVITGPTLTNVNDFRAILVYPQ